MCLLRMSECGRVGSGSRTLTVSIHSGDHPPSAVYRYVVFSTLLFCDDADPVCACRLIKETYDDEDHEL